MINQLKHISYIADQIISRSEINLDTDTEDYNYLCSLIEELRSSVCGTPKENNKFSIEYYI
jgi:hypothetical protein